MSKLIVSYRDVDIYENDLKLFREGNWLNDTCINFCLRKAESSMNDSILLLDPAVAAFLRYQVDDDEEMEDLAKNLNVLQREWIFIPVNDCDSLGGSGSHWSVLVCHVKSGYIAHLDSNGLYNKNSSISVSEKLTWMLGRTCRMPEDLTVPQQGNGYDCGVYAVLFILSVAAGLAVSEAAAGIPPAEALQGLCRELATSITAEKATQFRKQCIEDIRALSAAAVK